MFRRIHKACKIGHGVCVGPCHGTSDSMAWLMDSSRGKFMKGRKDKEGMAEKRG